MNPSTSSSARVRVAFVLCLLVLASAARAEARQAAQPAAALPAEKVRQIEALVGAEMAKQKIPGMTVAVVADRQVRWSAGFGMQDLENNVAARSATVYRLGWNVAVRAGGQRAIGHSGGQQRVSTFLHMQPEQGLAVVIMSNLEGARLGDLAQQIGDIVLK